MSFPLRYYASNLRKLTLGAVFIFSFFLFIYPLYLQMNIGFSFLFFSAAFIFMNVSFFIFFQWLKSLISPVVQIFPDEIILRFWRREVIKVEKVKSLKIKKGEIEIHYVRGTLELSKVLKISDHKNPTIEVRDGKII